MTPAGNLTAQRPLVLVVDDDAAVRNSLKFSLELEGFSVRSFNDGKELLAASALPENACLVIDYKIPGIDGLELIEQLRKRKVVLPAVLIVSHIDDSVSRRAAAAHIPVVEKPFLSDALLETIRGSFKQNGSAVHG